MSYALARPVLVAIVVAASTTTKVQGLGSALVHDKTINERVFGESRHFGVLATAGRQWGPATLSANIRSYDVALLVDYPDSDDAAAIDAAIVADYEAISAALSSSANWQTPASTIRCLGADSESANSQLFPFVVVDVEGGKRLRIQFPMEVSL